jgi:hypothetical protein
MIMRTKTRAVRRAISSVGARLAGDGGFEIAIAGKPGFYRD